MKQVCVNPCWDHSMTLATARALVLAFGRYQLIAEQWTANQLNVAAAVAWWNTHTHTHIHLMAFFLGLPRWAGTRKVEPIWILLKQETVSGSGISCARCKSAPCSRQITTPASHHSVFYRLDALPVAQPTASKHWRHRWSCCSMGQTDKWMDRQTDSRPLFRHNILCSQHQEFWISGYS